jgi:hypothetical protein
MQPQQPHLATFISPFSLSLLPRRCMSEESSINPRYPPPLTSRIEIAHMDHFELSPFSPALPGTLTFVQHSSSAELAPQHPFIFHEAPTGEPGIREMTRQQWESLKPLIQRIYMEENKPFPYLERILRDEHGFEPTYPTTLSLRRGENADYKLESDNLRDRLTSGDSGRTSPVLNDTRSYKVFIGA